MGGAFLGSGGGGFFGSAGMPCGGGFAGAAIGGGSGGGAFWPAAGCAPGSGGGAFWPAAGCGAFWLAAEIIWRTAESNPLKQPLQAIAARVSEWAKLEQNCCGSG